MKLAEIFEGLKSGYLFESPQAVSSTDFSLSDEAANKKLAAQLLKKKKETIEENDDVILFKTGDNINGYFALYNKHEQNLDYLIKYKAQKRKAIGSSVTQVLLWRRRGSSFVQGITRKVFFDILLKTWPAIMSDTQQTERGIEFWENRMAEATKQQQLKVGLFNEASGQMNWFDGTSAQFEKWMRGLNAWGSDYKFRDLRFVIANRS